MAEFPSGWFYIKSAMSDKVIQPLSHSYEPTRLVTETQLFGEDSRSQLWKHDNGHLVNKANSLCLDYEHGNFKRLGDIHICQWHRKVGKDAHNQRWLLRSHGVIACADEVSRVLEVKDHEHHAGAEVLLRKLDTVEGMHPDSQRWTLEVVMEDATNTSRVNYESEAFEVREEEQKFVPPPPAAADNPWADA